MQGQNHIKFIELSLLKKNLEFIPQKKTLKHTVMKWRTEEEFIRLGSVFFLARKGADGWVNIKEETA